MPAFFPTIGVVSIYILYDAWRRDQRGRRTARGPATPLPETLELKNPELDRRLISYTFLNRG